MVAQLGKRYAQSALVRTRAARQALERSFAARTRGIEHEGSCRVNPSLVLPA
jgi:hypothetical protein